MALHNEIVKGITSFIEEASSGKAGRRHSAVEFFTEVDDVDLIAHLTLRVILDSVSSRERVNKMGIEIVRAIEDELQFRLLRKVNPDLYRISVKRLLSKGNSDYRRKSLSMTATKAGAERMDMNDHQRLLVGLKLVEIVLERTKLIVMTLHTKRGNNTVQVLDPHPSLVEWIKKEDSTFEFLSPMYMPCVIPPKPWTSPFDGGYWTARCRKLTLVKTRDREFLEKLGDRQMPEVYLSINALQNTAWSVNGKVLEVMKAIWDRGYSHGVIPDAEEKPMPVRPYWLTSDMTKEQMTEEQVEAFKAWKAECALVHDENVTSKLRRFNFLRMINMAEKFSDQPFYYPYVVDFRGRVYPVSLYLQPQGDDAQRGLLWFANGIKIGNAEGADWLAIHGAGCWGVNKVTLRERVQWVFDHEQAILAAANDPLSHTFWMDTEKPWSALAFCFEWAGFVRDGYDHVSHLPVQMDGTCNGLQNFSAILRDEIGGAAVNLVPADKPQDIYSRVAEIVARRVEADAASSDMDLSTLAKGWVGNVTRKVCKRPVMTLAYGACEFGFKQQVFDDIVRPWKKDDPENFPWEGSGWDASTYMGKLIWESVGEVVVAARAAMDWLQEAARIAAKEGREVWWVSPTGFFVYQAYRVSQQKVIDTTFQKVRIQLKVNLDTLRLDSRRQASGISPNWVHSLDAAHMMKTVNRCTSLGMTDFCMIHDSYGTHAGNAAAMANALREEFVLMYSSHDVLRTFRDDLLTQLEEGTELPPLPPKGNLDLAQVLDSPFFFA